MCASVNGSCSTFARREAIHRLSSSTVRLGVSSRACVCKRLPDIPRPPLQSSARLPLASTASMMNHQLSLGGLGANIPQFCCNPNNIVNGFNPLGSGVGPYPASSMHQENAKHNANARNPNLNAPMATRSNWMSEHMRTSFLNRSNAE